MSTKYYLNIPSLSLVSSIANQVFATVFRTDFSAPGVALLRFACDVDSQSLRRFMVDLKDQLSELYFQKHSQTLGYKWAGRFNQQPTTEFHLDGAPEISYLMLGYEPSEIKSKVAVADYTKAAHDLGMSPQQLLDDHNPMYSEASNFLFPTSKGSLSLITLHFKFSSSIIVHKHMFLVNRTNSAFCTKPPS